MVDRPSKRRVSQGSSPGGKPSQQREQGLDAAKSPSTSSPGTVEKDPSKRQVRGSSPEDPLATGAGAGARRRPSRAFMRLLQRSGRAGAAANALLLLSTPSGAAPREA